jgi:hypothetical protein
MGNLTRASLLFGLLQFVPAVCGVGQLFIDGGSSVNTLACILVLLSHTLTVQFMQRTRTFHKAPIGGMAVLGMCVTTQSGALVAQTLSWSPLTEGLLDAINTFGWLATFQLLAVASLATFQGLLVLTTLKGALQATLRPLQILAAPSPAELWGIGLVGFAALGAASAGELGLLGRIVSGLRFLAWAPFLIPVLKAMRPGYNADMTKHWPALASFLLLAILMAIVVNARNLMFYGVVSAGLLLLMLTLRDDRLASRTLMLRVGIGVVIGLAALQPLADLATAMVVVRGMRDTASPQEMIEETVRVLFVERHKLTVYRQHDELASVIEVYDENYIDNPILARFVETKFHDNMLNAIGGLQPDEIDELWRISSLQVLGAIPNPVLKWLSVELDKPWLMVSMGDHIMKLSLGIEVGSFKTGSLFAHGLALFGIGFTAVYVLLCFIVFIIWESLCEIQQDGSLLMAPVGMLLVWPVFRTGVSGESIVALIHDLGRNFSQSVILYTIILWTVRLTLRMAALRSLAAIK